MLHNLNSLNAHVWYLTFFNSTYFILRGFVEDLLKIYNKIYYLKICAIFKMMHGDNVIPVIINYYLILDKSAFTDDIILTMNVVYN